MGLNTILWDLILQQKRLIKLIMDWMILYRIRDAFNGRHRIGDGIKEGFNGKGGQYFEILPIMVGSAGSVWLHTQSQYDGIDDTQTTEEEYQINN